MKEYELSHPQKRILFTQLLYENKLLFNIGGYVIYKGENNFTQLLYALKKTIKMMDCFSIRIIQKELGYKQYFVNEEPIVEEWKIGEVDDLNQFISKKTKMVMNTPFDFINKPLYRIMAFRHKEYMGYVLCCHHIIFDGWSANLFAEHVSKIYDFREGTVGEYKEFIKYEQEYINSKRGQKDGEYWTSYVQGKRKERNLAKYEHCCNSHREEFILSDETKELFVEEGRKWGGVNNILCACFILLDYLKNGDGTIAMSNYNRHGRRMRQTSGMFTNTLLVSVACHEEMTLSELLMEAKKKTNGALYHYQWPYDLMGIRNNEQVYRYNVNCYNASMNFKLGRAEGRYVEVFSNTQDIPFQMVLNMWDEAWKICCDMSDSIYHNGDGTAVIQFIECFLQTINDGPEQTIDIFRKILFESKLKRQRCTFLKKIENRTIFSDRIMRVLRPSNPEQTCIFLEDSSVSYKEFATLIYGAVDCIESYHIKKGDKVLLYMENGLQYIVYVYALAAKGICFTPIDIKIPVNQVEYIYADAEAKAIISNSLKTSKRMNLIEANLICGLEREMECIPEEKEAYLLYTSGTTGVPKGVLISRGALNTYLSWAERTYGTATFYLYSSPSFDLSLTTVFLPLTVGGAVVISEKNPSSLSNLINHKMLRKVNAIKATPSNLSLLLQQNISQLQLDYIICGGEELTTSLAVKLQRRFGKACKIYNEYGPTECTIGCMCHLFDEINDKKEAVSIGNGTPGTRVYVLDSEKQLCSVGETGELYLAGDQVALGYWRKEEENTKAFFNDLFGENIIYKTGDCGRYCSDGTVEYLGRIGRQCKINGYRVELDSIERVLKAIPNVNNAVVWASNEEYDKLLAAVETTSYSEKQLADIVAEKLPVYCVPHVFYIVDVLPVNRNGKVDIHFLEKKESRSESGDKKEILETILRDVLNYRDDMAKFDYYMAGGDSVRALRIISMLGERGYHLSLADLLKHSHFDDIARHVKQKIRNVSKIKKYKLPNHLQYFADICDDFRKYRHKLVVHYEKVIEEEKAVQLNYELRRVFPSLNATYEKGGIIEQDISDKLKWINIGNRKDVDWESVIDFDSKDFDLFSICIVTNRKESWIIFNAHHILVDGFSWKHLLEATSLILGGEHVSARSYMQIYKMDEKIELHYTVSKSIGVEHYYCVNMKKEIDFNLNSYEFAEAVLEVLSHTNNWNEYKLFFDCNGRGFIDLDEPDNIGCYSIILPIDADRKILKRQHNKEAAKKRICITDNLGIRMNYLGNINDMIPSNMHLELKSIEYSLQTCSAYGCMAEITGAIFDGEIILYFSWRNNDITEEVANKFLKELINELMKKKKKQLVSLSPEDENALFDDDFI